MGFFNFNNKTYFFSITYIKKDLSNSVTYRICLNNNYYILRRLKSNELVQIDDRPLIDACVLKEIGEVILEVDPQSRKRGTLELINKEVFALLVKLRNSQFKQPLID